MKKTVTTLFILSIFCMNLFPQGRAFEMNSRLGMGINLGNMFDAPDLGAWGVEADGAYIEEIKAKGFTSVRIPVRWSAHAEKEPPYTIQKYFMDTIRWAVDLALANELVVVMNMHHYEEIMEAPAAHKERYLALWEQIAGEFQHYSDSLYFEILNEPNGNFTPALWNEYLTEGLSKIREKNPERMVVIGTADWGGIAALSELVLPDDPNIILTIHYYEPFKFTHQGAGWTGQDLPVGVTWDSTATQIGAIAGDMNLIKQYSKTHNVPVYIGEFGAIENADDVSRAKWVGHLRSVFEEYGFSGAYWEFCSGFGIYDPALECYRTGMLRALTGFEGACDCSMFDSIIVKNSTFDKSIQPWFFHWFAEFGAVAKIGVVDGEARIEIISKGTDTWHIQFLYSSFSLVEGNTYTLTFDAYASSPTRIAAMINRDGEPYELAHDNNSYLNVDLTTEKKTFSLTFTYEKVRMDNARIAFDCGLANAQYIYFDNVYLYEKAPSSITNNAALSKCTVKAGENIFAVEGNSIEMITIYDISGRICYWKTYSRVGFVEIEDAYFPSEISFIQIRTDVKNMTVKNLKRK